MTSHLTTFIAVAVALGIMIFVHEWGHFVMAKLCGVRVDIFSLGFGPRLFGWRRGPTDYRLSALPFGGYVKMAGDNPVEERTGAPDEFLSRPRWQRALIAIAGPTMNILLAVVVTIGLFLVRAPEPAYLNEPLVLAGVLKDSPAEKAGLQAGDRIVRLGRRDHPKWEDAEFEIALSSPRSNYSLEVERAGRILPLTVQPGSQPNDAFRLLGYPAERVVLDAINRGGPADKAGLKQGDEIEAADGTALHSPVQLSEIIRQSDGKAVDFLVRRDGAEQHIAVQPLFGDPGDGLKRWQIGITFLTPTVVRSHSIGDATRLGVWFNVRVIQQIFGVLGMLFEHKIPLSALMGPVGIVQQSSEAVHRGLADFVTLMVQISLNLGIQNLLPIPILDGGHMLMLGIEGVLRRDLSLKVKERFVQVGLAFLLALIAFVTYHDVVRWWMPGR